MRLNLQNICGVISRVLSSLERIPVYWGSDIEGFHCPSLLISPLLTLIPFFIKHNQQRPRPFINPLIDPKNRITKVHLRWYTQMEHWSVRRRSRGVGFPDVWSVGLEGPRLHIQTTKGCGRFLNIKKNTARKGPNRICNKTYYFY